MAEERVPRSSSLVPARSPARLPVPRPRPPPWSEESAHTHRLTLM